MNFASARRLGLAILSILVILGCIGCSSMNLTEYSTNFDLEDVKPFLTRLSSHVEGFGPAQIDPLVEEISAMPIDAERSWEFQVNFRGQDTPLNIGVFMDDNEAPDVYFFTSPALADTIDKEMEAFSTELEQ